MMLVAIFVASELATSGSVMANADRISQFSNGSSHCFFCSGVPYSARISMFPVSGAEQLIASLPMSERPTISASGAYSRFVRPAPRSPCAMKRFHRPCSRAVRWRSRITWGCSCGLSFSAI